MLSIELACVTTAATAKSSTRAEVCNVFSKDFVSILGLAGHVVSTAVIELYHTV